MTSVLIACIILAVGAAAEVIAYVFTAKLLKKKEDGLNKRKAALDALEYCIKPADVPTFVMQSKNWVKVCGETHIDKQDIYSLSHMPQELIHIFIDGAKMQIWEQLVLRIPVKKTINLDGSITIRAELWVAEGGKNDA